MLGSELKQGVSKAHALKTVALSVEAEVENMLRSQPRLNAFT